MLRIGAAPCVLRYIFYAQLYLATRRCNVSLSMGGGDELLLLLEVSGQLQKKESGKVTTTKRGAVGRKVSRTTSSTLHLRLAHTY